MTTEIKVNDDTTVDTTVTTQDVVTSPKAAESAEDPKFMAQRLERERAKILKDLGVSSLDEARTAVTALNKQREESKSHELRAQELAAKLDANSRQVAELTESLKYVAESRLEGLTKAQRNAVESIAGEDPAKQLKALEALAPTWAKAEAETKAEVVKAAPKVTSAASSMPAPEVSGKSNIKSEYEALKSRNPIEASRFLLKHRDEIYPTGDAGWDYKR